MNEQNLIPNSQRSREELQAIGRKGGIASGKARRRNKNLRTIAAALLEDVDPGIVRSFSECDQHDK